MSAPCPSLGFTVEIEPRGSLTAAAALVADFIRLLEANDLVAGGDGRALQYDVSREGGQATHHDREIVRAWSHRWADVATITVGDIVDLEADAG